MPSVLRVTNLDNGQSTVVRVNDRGPFARSRVLDLSRAAAEELGMVGRGTATVRIEQLEAPSLALKQVALNGGGPDEQRAALSSSTRPALRPWWRAPLHRPRRQPRRLPRRRR
jgi:rare lipoprotein A